MAQFKGMGRDVIKLQVKSIRRLKTQKHSEIERWNYE